MFLWCQHKYILWILFSLACLQDMVANAWDSDELQLFDLVEDVNINFYEFLGLSQSASMTEVRRAYRKLSLSMHPDKNPNDKDANIKFRRLVAIYEVLKDEKKRQMYNDVLRDGLPDWRMPVFYYRKLRKMSVTETVGLLMLLSTIFHYAILWGIYIEKKLNKDDQLRTLHRRRLKQGDAKVEEEISQELSKIQKPTLMRNILPVALARGTYNFFVFLPIFFKALYAEAVHFKEQIYQKKQEEKEREELLQKEQEEKEARKQKKKEVKALKIEKIKSSQSNIIWDEPVVYQNLNVDDLPACSKESNSADKDVKTDDWTEEELCLLIRAVAKFPGGIPQRWEKISQMVGRPVSVVTAKMKHLKDTDKLKSVVSTVAQNKTGVAYANKYMSRVNDDVLTQAPVLFEVNANAECGDSASESQDSDAEISSQVRRRKKKGAGKKLSSKLQEEDMEEEDTNVQCKDVDEPEHEEQEVYISKAKQKAKKKSKSSAKSQSNGIPETSPDDVSSAANWTQQEQNALEAAMRAFPKGTQERWEKIVEQLPSKTKAECLDRVKYLSQTMKQRQHQPDESSANS